MKTFIKYVHYAALLGFWLALDACKKPAEPQVQGIVVTVKDRFTGKPIPNATVKWVSANDSDSGPTDKDGIYRKEGMKEGKYVVFVTANDYKLERAGKDMTVNVGAMSSETFELTPETLEITPKNVTFADGEKSKTVYFKNKNAQSSITLSIEVPQKDDWVKVSNPTLTIPAGSQKDITLTADSKGRGLGSYNTTVTLNFTINGRPDNDELNVYMNIPNPQAPSISTDVPTGVSQSSVDVRCTVTSIGGSTITDRGIYVSESSDPKASNSQKVSMGPGGIGSFVATAKGLKSGGKYFARGYATNSFGEGLGEVRDFVTSVEPTAPTLVMNPIPEKDVTLTTAVVSGKITSDGGSAIKEQGFVINTAGSPTVNDTKIQNNPDANGNMSQNLTNLTQNTTYHIRAYAINNSGKTGYSDPVNFRTKVPVVASEVITNGITNIRESSCLLEGSLKKLGSAPIEKYGFCLSRTNANPTVDVNNQLIELSGGLIEERSFTYQLTNLLKGTNYYVRAFIIPKGEKPTYGATKDFSTTEQGLLLYYPFNGDASDVSGNGNDGETNAVLSEDRHNNPKRAYDVSRGSLKVINSKIGNFRGDVSYSFWAKINQSSFTGSKKSLFGKFADLCFEDGGFNGFLLWVDPAVDSKIHFFVVGDGGKNSNPGIYDQSDLANDWHMITIIKSGSNTIFYLDGKFFDTKVTPITTDAYIQWNWASSTQYSIVFDGRNRSGCNLERFNAIIDDFRVYNYALSNDQVADLYKR